MTLPYLLEPSIVAEPAVLPVSLDEVDKHLNLSGTGDAVLLESKIRAAAREFEGFTNRTLTETTYQITLDSWPCSPFTLPRGYPLIAVDSITYRDTDGNTSTWNSALYDVDSGSKPGRVAPAYNESYPSVALAGLSPITITYRAGIADNLSPRPEVDPEVKQALLILIGSMYENREAEVMTDRAAGSSVELTLGYRRMLRNLTVTPTF